MFLLLPEEAQINDTAIYRDTSSTLRYDYRYAIHIITKMCGTFE